jgi:hypothetical protein
MTFMLLYFALLGNSGVIERKSLEQRLENLKAEVERLETENRFLTERQRLLANDEKALASEARKFYLLSENAKVLKFRELKEVDSGNSALYASGIPSNSPVKLKSENQIPPIKILRVIYFLTAASILIGAFFKWK